MQKTRTYLFLGIACGIGVAWLAFDALISHSSMGSPCLFKKMTGLPCPACGTTRAIQLLLHGDFAGSLYMNPLGIMDTLLLIALPILMAVDLFRGSEIVYRAYQWMERRLKHPQIFVPLIVLMGTNWAWNIAKGN